MANPLIYDRRADVLHVVLGTEDEETEGEEVSPGVTLVYDGDACLVGIEIASASRKLAPGVLDELPDVYA